MVELIRVALGEIDDYPVAQELIRCYACKYWRRNSEAYGGCSRICPGDIVLTNGEFYCAYGEKEYGE
jgi:hypothetical protein